MCGFVGLFDRNGMQDWDPAVLRPALQTLRRRGPDAEGVFSAHGVVVGHRRLSVIDPEHANQPFVDPSTGVVLVYNGEIYNFRIIRDLLAKDGVPCTTQSDTETLMHAYLRWGERCVERLVGMFAFAIYDPRDRTVFIARDRIGVKPLFYGEEGGTFFFASSVAALLALDMVDRRLDAVAVSHYLTTIRVTMGSRTLVAGISSLPPGETMRVRTKNGGASAVRYWDFPILGAEEKEATSLAEATRRTRALVEEAVADHLVSDVPVGGFLSGGLDSSVLAHVASSKSSGAFGTYSTGYDRPGYEEWAYAQEAATHAGLPCQEVHLAEDRYAGTWAWLVGNNGLPLSTPNEVAIYELARGFRSQYTVALTGEGADEVFGGYVIPYFSAFDYTRARREALPPGEQPTAVDRALSRAYCRPHIYCWPDHYFLVNAWIPFAQKRALLSDAAWEAAGQDAPLFAHYESLFDRFRACTTFDAYLHVHARVNLEGLLLRVDASTMAASVEARVPYTDHRVVDYLFTLPDAYKMDWRDDRGRRQAETLNAIEIDRHNLVESKILLRRAFSDAVPKSVLHRRKMSFPTPFDAWMRTTLRTQVEEWLRHSTLIQALCPRSRLDRLLRTADRPASARALWPLANLACWDLQFNLRMS